MTNQLHYPTIKDIIVVVTRMTFRCTRRLKYTMQPSLSLVQVDLVCAFVQIEFTCLR